MSSNTNIEWCKHTANPWWGCSKVHEGCDNCYAEALDNRWDGDHWGDDKPRRMILSVWSDIRRGQTEAEAAGRIDRVFCASMCDIFERSKPTVDQRGKDTGKTTGELREHLWSVIEETPNLDWLLLTKRPSNIPKMVPESWLTEPRANVMYGTSPANQPTADILVPQLLRVPGRRFLSVEPMLGEIDMTRALWTDSRDPTPYVQGEAVDHVIIGCESKGQYVGRLGLNEDVSESEWRSRALRLLIQCTDAGVPAFVKQIPLNGKVSHDPSKWPAELCVRQMPHAQEQPA